MDDSIYKKESKVIKNYTTVRKTKKPFKVNLQEIHRSSCLKTATGRLNTS